MIIKKIDWEKVNHLIPAIVQDEESGKVLMLGYQNQDAILETKKTGKVTFFSRTKQRLWTKGETSNHYLIVKSMELDCDGDSILYKVIPQGPTCHRGTETCFEHDFDLNVLEAIIKEKALMQEADSYTAKLLAGNEDRLYRKVTEEATEVLLAAKNKDNKNLSEEIADLFYHTLVTMKKNGLTLPEVYQVLKNRHEEKTK